MQPVYILADQEAEEAHALQLNQGHVGLRGPGILEGGVKLGGQATLLHGPHAMGAPEDTKQKTGTEVKNSFSRPRTLPVNTEVGPRWAPALLLGLFCILSDDGSQVGKGSKSGKSS